MQVRKQQLELDMEQQTGSKQEKEYVKAVHCHPDYLTFMQSTSWETLDWKKQKLESKLPGEISITSDMQMTPPLWLLEENLSVFLLTKHIGGIRWKMTIATWVQISTMLRELHKLSVPWFVNQKKIYTLVLPLCTGQAFLLKSFPI